jgi:hypothetical protein
MEGLFYFGVGAGVLCIFIFLVYLLGLFVGKVIFKDIIFLPRFDDIMLFGFVCIIALIVGIILFIALTYIGKFIIINI